MNHVGAAIDEQNVYVKIVADIPIKDVLVVFLQGDAPGLRVEDYSIKAGSNTIILKFEKKELLQFKDGLAVHLSKRNFVFIDKRLLDSIAKY